MWNARRNGRWFGWGCLFLSCSILLFRSAAVLRKNHFSEGKVLLQRAAAQAEQLSVDVMMPLLFYDGKEDGRGWASWHHDKLISVDTEGMRDGIAY